MHTGGVARTRSRSAPAASTAPVRWLDAAPVSATAAALGRRQIMHQSWLDIAFLHWRVPAEVVAPLLPAGTRPDVIDGSSWVGLIPFRMVGAGVGRGPSVPWLGTFAEINVRLYAVDATGRRGVVFRSLEASRLAVCLAARGSFGVPYCWARMSIRHDVLPGGGSGSAGDIWTYTTRRRWPSPRGAGTRIVVQPSDVAVAGDPVADFLTARWGLHSRWAGRTLFVPNEHEAWPLRAATLVSLTDDLVAAAGLPGVTDRPPDSVLFSAGVRTVFGLPFGVPS